MVVAQPILESKRLRLVPFDMNRHASHYQVLANDEKIANTTYLQNPYTIDMAKKWIKEHQHTYAAQEEANYAITLKADDILVGAINLLRSENAISAEIGYFIGSEYWGQGYASEAVGAVIEFGFMQFNIEHIFAHCLKENKASYKLLEKNGFSFEKQVDQFVEKWGRNIQVLEYGLHYFEWFEN